jgi:hypothetical protein
MPKQNKKNNKNQKRNNNNKSKRDAKLLSDARGDYLTKAYFNTLTNPFRHQGVKLGWGSMAPTAIQSAYLRGTITANADGSAALLAIPCAVGLLMTKTAGAAVATTVRADATDAGPLDTNFTAGRVISLGIKAYPSIAATDAPGICYAGALEGQRVAILDAMTPADLASFPQGEQSIASLGASATGRPQDPRSFQFEVQAVNSSGFAAGSGTQLGFSIPFISFIGLPASAVVAYEVIMNVECMAMAEHSGAGLAITDDYSDKLSAYWPSFEQMWSKVQPYLPSPAQAYNAASRAVEYSTTLGRLAGANPKSSMPLLLNYR